MAARTPFISTDVGFAKQLKGGVIVDSEQAMAGEIHRLLADECLHKSLGEEGRTLCERTYSWKSVMKAYDTLLERLARPSEPQHNDASA
jgi:glycosyltransferase involved in cell wall biosynthesis